MWLFCHILCLKIRISWKCLNVSAMNFKLFHESRKKKHLRNDFRLWFMIAARANWILVFMLQWNKDEKGFFETEISKSSRRRRTIQFLCKLFLLNHNQKQLLFVDVLIETWLNVKNHNTHIHKTFAARLMRLSESHFSNDYCHFIYDLNSKVNEINT